MFDNNLIFNFIKNFIKNKIFNKMQIRINDIEIRELIKYSLLSNEKKS